MAQYKEYSLSTVTGNPCGYATLSSYNLGGCGSGIMAPVASGVPSMNVQIVPTYSAPGYDWNKHGQKYLSCGNYFNIQSAYPNYSNNCTKFTTRLCGGQ